MAENERNVATPHRKQSHLGHPSNELCLSWLYAKCCTAYTSHWDNFLIRVLFHPRRSVTTVACHRHCTINNGQVCSIRRLVARQHNLHSQTVSAVSAFQRDDFSWLWTFSIHFFVFWLTNFPFKRPNLALTAWRPETGGISDIRYINVKRFEMPGISDCLLLEKRRCQISQ